MKLKYFLISLAILLIIPLITASSLGTFQQGNCIDLPQTCGNCSYVNISSIMFPNSSQAVGMVEMTKLATKYNHTFCNTNELGVYIVNTYGDDDGVVTTNSYDFEITPNGKITTTGTSIFYLGGLIILIFLMGGTIYGWNGSDKIYTQFIFFILFYLCLITSSYLAWIGSTNYLPFLSFLGAFFRIIFFVLILGLIPLVFGTLIYIGYMAMTTADMKRMLEHGVPEDRALTRRMRRR